MFTDENNIAKAIYEMADIKAGKSLYENYMETNKRKSTFDSMHRPARFSLLIADDHVIITKGLKLLINKFLPHTQIDEVHDGHAALAEIQNHAYDLLILDVNMPGSDPFKLLTEIFLVKPELKVLMFSMSDELIYATKYLQMGAMGYLQKDEPAEEIRKAIVTVLGSKKYISTRLSRMLMQTKNKLPENLFDCLSLREIEITRYLVRGESVSAICEALKLHTSTVSTIKSRIFKKLQCANIIELNALAKIHNI